MSDSCPLELVLETYFQDNSQTSYIFITKLVSTCAFLLYASPSTLIVLSLSPFLFLPNKSSKPRIPKL